MTCNFSTDERAFIVFVNYCKALDEWRAQEPKWWHFIAHYKWRKAEPQIEWEEK